MSEILERKREREKYRKNRRQSGRPAVPAATLEQAGKHRVEIEVKTR